MKIRFVTYARFADVFDREIDIELATDTTIYEGLKTLCGDNLERIHLLYEEDGSIRSYVIIMKNRERIESSEINAISLHEGDEIVIYPPVSGG